MMKEVNTLDFILDFFQYAVSKHSHNSTESGSLPMYLVEYLYDKFQSNL